MKKLVVFILCLCLLFAFPVAASAEAADAALDLTGVIETGVALVAAVVLCLTTYVWRRWIQPWLVQNELMEVAEIVVNAVEAIVGRYNGEQKWAMALEKMEKEYGFDVNNAAVLDALRAAWKQLDLSMLTAGEKHPAAEEVPVEAVELKPPEPEEAYIGM